MKKASVVLLLVLLAGSLYTQEWSAAQKEVWKNVETYWGLAAKGDIENFITYYHPDFCGWNINSYLPQDKACREKFGRYNVLTNKTVLQDLTPVAIKIHGNVAIVHYTYVEITKNLEGKEKTEQGRWTDILLKQGDKWIMIGDSGGAIPKEQED
jgi:hypothetical protein